MTFAIHGSGLAPGNVLLPGCWETYRTLRKSNILHKSQILYKPSQISLSQVLKSLLLLHFDKYNIASLIIFEFTLIEAYLLIYIHHNILLLSACRYIFIVLLSFKIHGYIRFICSLQLYKFSLWQTPTNYKSSKQISFPLRSFISEHLLRTPIQIQYNLRIHNCRHYTILLMQQAIQLYLIIR